MGAINVPSNLIALPAPHRRSCEARMKPCEQVSLIRGPLSYGHRLINFTLFSNLRQTHLICYNYNVLRKFFQDYFSYQLSHILGGTKYNNWAEKNLTLFKSIPIKNKLLAKELEEACKKNGYLTYFEFLTIDQFGKNGYHSTHKEHGMTDVKYRWPEALAALCKKKNIHLLVEFGPGDGVVGVKTILEGKKINHKIFWSGVEIGEELRQKAKKLFRKKGIEKNLLQLVSRIDELNIQEKCLFVFSYSLENLISDVFINTSKKIGPPNKMLGVQVKNGFLSEMVIEMKQSIMNLKKYQLNYMQRLYLPLEAFRTIKETLDKIPKDSQILIIDEFREPSHLQPYHLGLPRDLETFSRDFTDFEKFYKTAGSNLLYFPIFLDFLEEYLKGIGLSVEKKMGENKFAYSLSGKNGPYPKNPRTYALLTLPKSSF